MRHHATGMVRQEREKIVFLWRQLMLEPPGRRHGAVCRSTGHPPRWKRAHLGLADMAHGGADACGQFADAEWSFRYSRRPQDRGGDLFGFAVAAERMMMGNVNQPRRLAMTSLPSMSGSPRFEVMTSGAAVAAALIASAPFSPPRSRHSRRQPMPDEGKRRICGSSSTTRNTSQCHRLLPAFTSFGHRKAHDDACATLFHRRTLCIYAPAQGFDKASSDGKTKPGSWRASVRARNDDRISRRCGRGLRQGCPCHCP